MQLLIFLKKKIVVRMAIFQGHFLGEGGLSVIAIIPDGTLTLRSVTKLKD